jgi:diaminopimelate decarboxylase
VRPSIFVDPSPWNLERRDGRLHADGHDLCALADQHGTPLHVASARTLRLRCDELQRAFGGYPGRVRIHFSYKTNRVAGILRVIHERGLGAEVVDGYELWLADRLGVAPDDVVVNGPNKSDEELRVAIGRNVGLLVVDGLEELTRVERIAAELGVRARIGLRVCPDVVPRGVNTSSMTGSRRNQFGLDLKGGEASEAIARAARAERLELRGLMAHIGSGIHDLRSYRRTVGKLLDLQLEASRAGAEPDLLDVGGGLGTRLSREFTTLEMLAYLGTGRLPKAPKPGRGDLFARYGRVVSEAVIDGCRDRGLPIPTLILEPGRALVSDSQVLLLRVGTVRNRPGVGRFALTDGGAMTVSMMFLSEYHSVLLANREAGLDGRTSVFGRLPSPMDVVYRNMPLPKLRVGDLLAVMDAGAYFTSTATNFGGPRPGVVLVDGGEATVIRRAERYEDLARLETGLDGDPDEPDPAP